MRIHQMSDLHLEFNHKFRATNPYDADILMLNGDICVADYLTRSKESPKYYLGEIIKDFFKQASDNYEHVVYIMGNHEHYHGTYIETANTLREHLSYGNVNILDNSSIELYGYKIIGATLWTDCDKGNPLVLEYLRGYLNDFKIVKYSKEPYKGFWPIDSVVDHKASLNYIDLESEGHDKVIVMSHHAPSVQSIHRSYQDPMYYYGNRGYYSDLDQFIMDRPQIKLWTHGHVHNNFDYMIGDTKIVCNPHGYGTENIHGFNRGNIIELF
jgi:Icc-related predicted phosphoesterase